MKIERMIKNHPRKAMVNEKKLGRLLESVYECAQTCVACADACLGEDSVADLIRCIRLNQDCADVCDATGRIMSRQTQGEPVVMMTQLEACTAACHVCAEECEKHSARHEHCEVCAEACRHCEEACKAVLGELQS